VLSSCSRRRRGNLRPRSLASRSALLYRTPRRRRASAASSDRLSRTEAVLLQTTSRGRTPAATTPRPILAPSEAGARANVLSRLEIHNMRQRACWESHLRSLQLYKKRPKMMRLRTNTPARGVLSENQQAVSDSVDTLLLWKIGQAGTVQSAHRCNR